MALDKEQIRYIIATLEGSQGKENPVAALSQELDISPITVMSTYRNKKYVALHKDGVIARLKFQRGSHNGPPKKKVNMDMVYDVIETVEQAAKDRVNPVPMLTTRYGLTRAKVAAVFYDPLYKAFHTGGVIPETGFLESLNMRFRKSKHVPNGVSPVEFAKQVIQYAETTPNVTAAEVRKQFQLSYYEVRNILLGEKFSSLRTQTLEQLFVKRKREPKLKKTGVSPETVKQVYTVYLEITEAYPDTFISPRKLGEHLRLSPKVIQTSLQRVGTDMVDNGNEPIKEDFELEQKLNPDAVAVIIHTLEDNPFDRHAATKLAERFVVSRQTIYNVFKNPRYAEFHRKPEIEANYASNVQRVVSEYLTTHPNATRNEVAEQCNLTATVVLTAVARLGVTLTETPREYRWGEQISSAVLTEERAEALLTELLDGNGKNRLELARKYQVSPMTAYRIYRGQTWRPVYDRIMEQRQLAEVAG